MRGDWPLAITAYNHGRNGISRALDAVGGKTLMDLINRFDGKRFGFASKNYYAEFLAAVDVEREYRQRVSAERQVKRSEEHTSEHQSLMRSSYAVVCLKKKNTMKNKHQYILEHSNR